MRNTLTRSIRFIILIFYFLITNGIITFIMLKGLLISFRMPGKFKYKIVMTYNILEGCFIIKNM